MDTTGTKYIKLLTDDFLVQYHSRNTSTLFISKRKRSPVNCTPHACSIQFQTQTGSHCATTECL